MWSSTPITKGVLISLGDSPIIVASLLTTKQTHFIANSIIIIVLNNSLRA